MVGDRERENIFRPTKGIDAKVIEFLFMFISIDSMQPLAKGDTQHRVSGN